MVVPDNTLYVVSGILPSDKLSKYDRYSSPMLDFIYSNRKYGIEVVGLEYSISKSALLHRLAITAFLRNLLFAINLLIHRKDVKNYILSSEDLGIPLAICAYLMRKNVNIVCQMHGFLFPTRFFKTLLGLSLRHQKLRFGAISESLRRTLVADYKVNEKQCFNTSYGTDTIFFESKTEHRATTIISSAGASNRDYKTLIKAVKDLPYDVKIAAASPWANYDHQKEPTPSNCEIRSYGNYTNLRQLYADSTISVIPLDNVTFATGYAAIGEILSMGIPLIVTKTGAPADFMIDGETVLFVRPNDAEDLKSKILLLLNNPELRTTLSENSTKIMRDHYSVEAFVDRLIAGFHSP